MRQFSIVFIVLIFLCTLISCEKDEKIDMAPMKDIIVNIIDSHIYTTEIQEGFEIPHYAVFAIVHCEVHSGYAGISQINTDYPLLVLEETPGTLFADHPIYNNGDTINVKITEHLKTDLKEITIKHADVVFIGFCTQGTYKFNVNGFEKEFRVGHIK